MHLCPCILKSLDGTAKSLLSHHPFPLNGDPEDRIERLVILIKKLLLKMALSNHKVMEAGGKDMVQMITAMDFNRLMIWKLRKTKPCPKAAVWLLSIDICNETWLRLQRQDCMRDDEFALSDDHFRIFDTFGILYNVLEYVTGPVAMQMDLKDVARMFPEDMQPMLTAAQNSTFLVTVDRLLDALEHQLIPFPEVVKIICFGEVKKNCSICDEAVTVTEVKQFMKRLGTVACFFNTLNMGMVRCDNPMCDLLQDNHPSRVDYGKWYPIVETTFMKFKENLCHFCFKLSPHGAVHRCGNCLSKVYCSKVCQTDDWSLIHSKICKSSKGSQRKVKGKAKERKEVGETAVQGWIQEMEENHLEHAVVGGRFDPQRFFHFGSVLEEIKELL